MSKFLVGLDLQDVQVDTFSGNASTTAFTLSVASTTNGAAVHISGVRQVPTTDYGISGTTITVTTAPPTGTNNVAVMYTKTAILNTPADDSVTSAKIGDDQIDSEHYVAGSIDLEHMSSQSVDEDNLHISNSGSNGNFLSKQSGDAGGLTWAAAGGAWNLIGTVAASNDSTLTVTGLDSTYDTYALAFSDLHPQTDGVEAWLRMGDSGGIDSGASDYEWAGVYSKSDVGTPSGQQDPSAAEIELTSTYSSGPVLGNAAGEGFGGVVYLNRPGDGSTFPNISGMSTTIDGSAVSSTILISGHRKSVITLTQLQFLFSSGNLVSGRFSVWGVSHA